VLALAGVYGQAAWQRKAYVRELEGRVRQLAPAAKKVALEQKLLMVLEEQVDKSGTFVELFGKMCGVAPRGINILRLTFTHAEGMEVEGTALSDLLVNQWTEALRAVGKQDMPQFAEARSVKTSRAEKVHNQEIVGFKISVPFPKPSVSGELDDVSGSSVPEPDEGAEP